MNNIENSNYIQRRDELIRIMKKQNFLAKMDSYNESKTKSKRGRKPTSSK